METYKDWVSCLRMSHSMSVAELWLKWRLSGSPIWLRTLPTGPTFLPDHALSVVLWLHFQTKLPPMVEAWFSFVPPLLSITLIELSFFQQRLLIEFHCVWLTWLELQPPLNKSLSLGNIFALRAGTVVTPFEWIETKRNGCSSKQPRVLFLEEWEPNAEWAPRDPSKSLLHKPSVFLLAKRRQLDILLSKEGF